MWQSFSCNVPRGGIAGSPGKCLLMLTSSCKLFSRPIVSIYISDNCECEFPLPPVCSHTGCRQTLGFANWENWNGVPLCCLFAFLCWRGKKPLYILHSSYFNLVFCPQAGLLPQNLLKSGQLLAALPQAQKPLLGTGARGASACPGLPAIRGCAGAPHLQWGG